MSTSDCCRVANNSIYVCCIPVDPSVASARHGLMIASNVLSRLEAPNCGITSAWRELS